MKYLLGLCTAILLAACGGEKENNAPASSNAPNTSSSAWVTYKVGSHLTYPPFHFLDGQPSKATGFEIELLQAVAQAGEFNVEIQNAPRKALVQTLDNGTFDIWASTISINPERQAQMDFSKPFLDYDNEVIYILDNDKNKAIQTLADFKGKRLAVNDFSPANAEKAAKITGSPDNVTITKSYHLSMKNMYSGKVDGAMDNGYVLSYYLKDKPEYPNLKTRVLLVEEKRKEFAFAVKKGNTALLEKINKGLEKVKADGTYARLTAKWFGDIRPTPTKK